MTGTGEAVLFWIVAPLMVLGGLGLVFTKRAIYAALCMALTMILLGIVYIAQGAEFLGLVHVFVYTGAVMMLFLFVVMMIGVDASESTIDTIKGHRVLSLVVVVGLAALLISTITRGLYGEAPPISQMNAEGNVTGLAYLIFGRYMWVFQLTAALLITAALAAMVLAHRERLLPKPTQREWSERRIRENVTKSRLTALSMSSTPMKTMIALRRRSTVAAPIAKSSAARTRELVRLIATSPPRSRA